MERLTEELMALRAAKEIKAGDYVNLGFGIPSLISDLVPESNDSMFHSENGVLGFGHISEEKDWDPERINAAGNPINLLPGASIFNQVDAFAMMRGPHLDITFLGAYQVSKEGDLANWLLPERGVGGIGGAMDLTSGGVKRVIVLMKHVNSKGEPRLVNKCLYPLTARRIVNRIITDLAVVDVSPQGLMLTEMVSGCTVEDIQDLTEPGLIVSKELKEIEF